MPAKYDPEYYQKNKEHIRKREQQGLPFNLEFEDVVIPDVCPVFKVPMVKRGRYAPSLDRKIPHLGYVKGNVQVISRLANNMKQNASPEELKMFAEWVLDEDN